MDHSHSHHQDHSKQGHQPEAAAPLEQETAHQQHKQEAAQQHHNADEHVFQKHAGHHTGDFLKRFWICLLVTIPILLLSKMIQHWFGFHISFVGDKYILLALGTFIYVYGGWPFLAGMVNEIRHKAIGMMTLVAIAITVAYVYSVAVTFGLAGMDFYWELATLIDIMLLGHWLEMRSEMAASRALESLIALLPARVHVERGNEVIDIELKDLKNGDIALIKPGEKVPADGLVLDGRSYVNESMLTGESAPVEKSKDGAVIGGAINGDGSLKIKITGTGRDSYLNKVVTLVQNAQLAKSKTQNLADRVAKWLTIISITTGIITFLYWYVNGTDLAFALERTVTVMVTACPHALGVAIPLVVAISTTVSATNGLLIRNRTAFENSRKLTTVIFDKTGTLTKGLHEIQKIIPLTGGYTREELLQYVASIQQNSEHHIARGIMKKQKEEGIGLLPVQHFKYWQGMGVSGEVAGKIITSVGPNYFKEKKMNLPDLPSGIDTGIETINYILINDEVVGIITLSDAIRETSNEAVQELKKLKIKSFLLTGDNEHIASAVASKLGIDGYMANVLPHEKQQKVKELQGQGQIVAMTGDGVNDAPALAQADVGIAVGSGTDIAAETADIILVNSDPRDIVNVISFGKKTYRKMVQNLAWAAGYNIIAIPLAAGVLTRWGIVLSPAVGAILMSFSTIIVSINAQMLKRALK